MEMIEVLNPQGVPTGVLKSKAQIHLDGDWHLAVHIWVVDEKGNWLLQRRSPQKINDPNLWDISVAGHVSAGESDLTGACREVEEEIGLTIQPRDLTPLFRIREPRILNEGTYLDYEFHQVYLLRRSFELTSLKLQTEEVAEVSWFSTPQFQAWVNSRDERLVPHWEEYQRVLAILSEE